MKIKEVTNQTKVSEHALRFYESKGLLHPKRNENGYRDYDQQDIQRILFIHLYRTMGFSIRHIKQLFEQMETQNQIQLFFEQQAFLNQQIKELTIIREGISECLNETLMKEDAQDETIAILQRSQENVMQNKQWIDKWNFDSWATQYDNVVKAPSNDGLAFYKHYEEVLNRCADIVNMHGNHVLEIGVGTGNLISRLHSKHVVGIDQSIQMLMETKKKYPYIPVRLGTFLNIPFPSQSFDCVVTSYAFHHNQGEEKKQAIEEMDRVLMSKGHIVLCDLMFENTEARNTFEQHGSAQARIDLQDEYFANVDELCLIFESMKYKCSVEKIDELIWIITLEKP